MDNLFLPSKDRAYLTGKQIKFREIENGAVKGLVLDDFAVVPTGKFNKEKSSLLIILPAGYPDVPPDMFYFSPELKLVANDKYPAQADQFPTHFSEKWQQWSRHAPVANLRAGKDGIHTYLQRVYLALNTAA
jgi:hypothetical protein